MTSRFRTRLLALVATLLTAATLIVAASPAQASTCDPEPCGEVSAIGKLWWLLVADGGAEQVALASERVTVALNLLAQGAPDQDVLSALADVAAVLAPGDAVLVATAPGLAAVGAYLTEAIKLLVQAKLNPADAQLLQSNALVCIRSAAEELSWYSGGPT